MTTSRQFFDLGRIHRISDAVSACLPTAAHIIDERERASADGNGITRAAFGPDEQAACEMIARAAGELELEVGHNADGSMDFGDFAEGCRVLVAVLAKRGCQR